jgi:hypothetical protein
VVWWRPHLHRHQWIVPEYIRTLDSTAVNPRWSEVIGWRRIMFIQISEATGSPKNQEILEHK